MFAKLTVLIIAATALGAGLLGLRQQRLEASHQAALLHHRMAQTRQTLWELQSQVCDGVEPGALRQAMTRANLRMEPLIPTVRPTPPAPARQRVMLAEQTRPRRGER